MKKNMFGIVVVYLASLLFVFFSPVLAAGDNNDLDWFNIIPELDQEQVTNAQQAIQNVWQTWKQVWKTYRQTADSWLTTSEQLATWIMNRNTIMDYLVFVVQFISQLWITVWVVFIMYAWYQYMISVFNDSKPWTSMLKNAIIGVIIVIFSYAILKTLTSLIWLY